MLRRLTVLCMAKTRASLSVAAGVIALTVGSSAVASLASAQATRTPSFNAPYRAFNQHEFGGTISFITGGGLDATALEGQYRFGYRSFDIGARGGLLLRDDPAENSVILGIEARTRVITHTESFPLDGAIIFGAGLDIDGGTSLILPIGLSLGRRLDVRDSKVSIVPYVQPTGFLVNGRNPAGNRDTDFDIGIGIGADFRLSELFDARISVGIGDGPKGVSISAVWVR